MGLYLKTQDITQCQLCFCLLSPQSAFRLLALTGEEGLRQPGLVHSYTTRYIMGWQEGASGFPICPCALKDVFPAVTLECVPTVQGSLQYDSFDTRLVENFYCIKLLPPFFFFFFF